MRAFTANPSIEPNPHVFMKTIKFMTYRTPSVTYIQTKDGFPKMRVIYILFILYDS